MRQPGFIVFVSLILMQKSLTESVPVFYASFGLKPISDQTDHREYEADDSADRGKEKCIGCALAEDLALGSGQAAGSCTDRAVST